MKKRSMITSVSLAVGLMALSGAAIAAGDETFGSLAERVTESFAPLAKLITAIAYLAGLGFGIGAVMKFKQHKDNPTQIPIGTPVAMTFIAAALLFFPSMLGITGGTLFKNPETAGPKGVLFEKGSN